MSAPFSFADDMPEPCSRAHSLNLSRLRRERDAIVNLMDDCIRMVERQRAGDASFTGVGCRLTLAQTRNALESFLMSLRDVETEVMPSRPLPVLREFGRRPALPAVVSPESAA